MMYSAIVTPTRVYIQMHFFFCVFDPISCDGSVCCTIYCTFENVLQLFLTRSRDKAGVIRKFFVPYSGIPIFSIV